MYMYFIFIVTTNPQCFINDTSRKRVLKKENQFNSIVYEF